MIENFDYRFDAQPGRRNLFGIQVDAIRMPDAIATIREWSNRNEFRCRYVVTPNVDHAVMLQEHFGLRDAYSKADLVLADGHPLVWASRLLAQPLPERVPGSDLVPTLFDSVRANESLQVFLLGAAPGVADRAAVRIRSLWPRVEVVGTYSPPFGFENSAEETGKILEKIQFSRPDVLIVGLGAPKQECWVHRNRESICAKVALCVGATIDFLALEKRRAPRWMQSAGIEWLHRMLSEPRRLVRRYAKDAWVFPQLVWRQLRSPRTISG